VQAGLLEAGRAQLIEDNVTAAASIAAAVADADIVIEAVTEDPDVKAGVFSAVERAARADAVIATNTSAIPIRELASTLDRPDRFLGLHWFNPPQWVPGVEVIAGPQTRAEVVERCHQLVRRMGKRPVSVGDSAGFVANRIQFAMFKEAVQVVADGVATAEQVDEIVRTSFGFRLPFYGPFAIADMAGLDVYAGAYAALERELGPRFAAPPALRELVDSGNLGTKSGGGFLGVTGDAVERMAAQRDSRYAGLAALIDELDAENPA
jgi:3-hydroxybutyryl-CoA dehydrogenase